MTEENKTSPHIEFIDFWAAWCGPCKIMAPVLDEIETTYKDKITLSKYDVDADTSREMVEKYNIMSIPTYLLLKDGQVAEQFIGVQPKEVITKKLDSLLA